MAYSKKTIAALQGATKTLGTTLGSCAVLRGLSVVRVAHATGATRQSVYNWFSGGTVMGVYRPKVTALILILQNDPELDTEILWGKICTTYSQRV